MVDLFKEISYLPKALTGVANTSIGSITGYAEDAVDGILAKGAQKIRDRVTKNIDNIINELSGVNLSATVDEPYKISKGKQSLMYPNDLGDTSKYREYLQILIKVPAGALPSGISKLTVSGSTAAGGPPDHNTTEYIIDYGKETYIFLPVPNSGLTDATEVTYGEEAMGILGTIGDLDWDNIKNKLGGDIGSTLLDKVKTSFLDGVTGSKLGTGRLKAMGKAFNPKNEMLLDSVKLRTWEFEYMFAPRNEQELTQALAIIKIMRFTSLPGFSDKEENVYDYPATYNITLKRAEQASTMQGGRELEDLYRLNELYCTSVGTDWTPNSVWTSFANGKPTHFKMTLAFTETKPISRIDIITGA